MDTIPQAAEAAEAVRQLPCLLCAAAPGQPCAATGNPSLRGDHLKRWIDAYTAGRVTKADMAAVFARIIVITKYCIVPELPAAAARQAGAL